MGYKELTVQQWIVTGVLAIVAVQAIGIIFGLGIALGPFFSLLLFALIPILLIRFLFRKDFEFKFFDVVSILLFVGGILLLMSSLETLVPEAFSVVVQQFQSVVGLQ